MASHQSAVKAHRQSLKRRAANREQRTRLRTALKTIRAAIESTDGQEARTQMRDAISLIDKMASKGIIHANAAGRYKSRLTTRLTALGKR